MTISLADSEKRQLKQAARNDLDASDEISDSQDDDDFEDDDESDEAVDGDNELGFARKTKNEDEDDEEPVYGSEEEDESSDSIVSVYCDCSLISP